MQLIHQLNVVGWNHAFLVSSLDNTNDPSFINRLTVGDDVILHKTHFVVILCIVVIYGTVLRAL